VLRSRDQHFEETQSWNIYSYCMNQPTMMIDPTGMWTGKVHVQMTAILAYAAGYSQESASRIGLATGKADEVHNALDAGLKGAASMLAGGSSAGAEAGYLEEARHHFPELGDLPNKEAAFQKSGSVDDFGAMEHLKQDGENPGHKTGIIHGPGMDRTASHQDEAMKTAEKTFNDLMGAAFKSGEVSKDAKAIDFKALMPELKAYMAAGESGKGYEKAKNALWSKVSSLRQEQQKKKEETK
jgi:hypothetical protein